MIGPKKCAIVGLGYWGSIVSKYFEMTGYVCVDVFSYRDGNSFDAFCRCTEAEVIFICSPVSTHYSYAKTALQNGKHVFCEKMLTADYERAQELYRIADDNQCVLFTDYIYLYSPSIQYLKANRNRLGELLKMQLSISQFGKFYADADVLENIGVHMLSVVGYLTDFNHRDDVMDVADICVPQYQNRVECSIRMQVDHVRVTIECSLVGEEKQRRIRLLGDCGVMVFDAMKKDTVYVGEFMQSSGTGQVAMKEEHISYDETNNLQQALNVFRQIIDESGHSVDYKENRNCSLYVEEMVRMLKRHRQ